MSNFRAFLFAVSFLFLTTASAGPLDINSADAQAIAAAMVGIGTQKAEAIVAYREAHGPFQSVDELTLVKGVGASTLLKNQERITVVPQRANR